MSDRRSAAAPVAGNVYDKHGTRNPLARWLVDRFHGSMAAMLGGLAPVRSVLEVGCGEGHVTAHLRRWFPGASVLGTDLSEEVVAEARRRHPGGRFSVESIYDAGAGGERYDLVVACEVLEHVEDPRRALAALTRSSAGWVFVSVPREPLWRALNLLRGHYVRQGGNTPGHVQHWSTRGVRRLLSEQLEVTEVRTPLPWTQLLCRRRP